MKEFVRVFSSKTIQRAICYLAFCFLCALAVAGEAYNWPHWRGTLRNGITVEDSGWENGGWPLTEPVWHRNFGAGGSSPIVVDGRVYVLGRKGEQDRISCVRSATGEVVWEKAYESPEYGRYSTGDEGFYAGPSSTPEYDIATGYLYTLGIDGALNCWDTKAHGEKVWHINLYDAFGVGQRPKATRSGLRDYGYTTSPLIYGDWLIVEVGDDEGNLMAFDKLTGVRKWTSQSNDPAGHTAGPALMTVQGVPCVVVLTLKRLLVVRLDPGHEGETVASYEWATDYANSIAAPAVHENFVVITSGYNHRTICQLEITLEGARKVWEQPYFSQICTPVIYDGHIYWSWEKVTCLDFATGALKWAGGKFGDAGSCIVTGDGRLLVWAHRGTLALVETAERSPDTFEALTIMKDLFQTDVWPHVVFCDGRIYCKDRDGNLKCFQLSTGKASVD